MFKKLPIIFIIFLPLVIVFLFVLKDNAWGYICIEDGVCHLTCLEGEYDPDCDDIGEPCGAGDCGTQPDNLCCTTSGGCSSGGRLGCDSWMDQWTWCHSPSCVVVDIDGCDWKWVFEKCGATDSCLGGPYLYPGYCSEGGCEIGPSRYKVCCAVDGAGNLTGYADGNCVGGQFTGSCPGGSETRFCGWGG